MERTSTSIAPISVQNDSDYWKHHVKCWKESGLSKKIYCKQANIRYHVFEYRYRKLYGKLSTPSPSISSGFIQISSMNNYSLPSFSDSGIRLSLSDVQLELSRNFDELSLSRVLKVLRES